MSWPGRIVYYGGGSFDHDHTVLLYNLTGPFVIRAEICI